MTQHVAFSAGLPPESTTPRTGTHEDPIVTRVSATVLSVALLAGCSAASPTASESIPIVSTDASQSPEETNSGGPSASQGGGGTGLGQIRLQVDSGDFAGEWTGEIIIGGCSRNLIASEANPILPVFVENTFSAGAPAVTVTGLPEFTFLFEIYDSAAAATGTDQFHFGLLARDNTGLAVDPPDGTGSGSATLDDRGDTATLHAEATFADGSLGSVDVDCYQVGDGE